MAKVRLDAITRTGAFDEAYQGECGLERRTDLVLCGCVCVRAGVLLAYE